jgi:Anti-sigma factor NepR
MTKDQQGAPGARPRRNGQSDLLGANSEIGRKLRQYYDELISDEVPDRFTQLLRQLEEAASAQKKD